MHLLLPISYCSYNNHMHTIYKHIICPVQILILRNCCYNIRVLQCLPRVIISDVTKKERKRDWWINVYQKRWASLQSLVPLNKGESYAKTICACFLFQHLHNYAFSGSIQCQLVLDKFASISCLCDDEMMNKLMYIITHYYFFQLFFPMLFSYLY